MRQKTTIKQKLFLKKETIANLRRHEMFSLRAGVNVFDEVPNTTTRPDSYCPIETCGCNVGN